MESSKAVVAFGPAVDDRGSWEWVGADLEREMRKYFKTVCWRRGMIPASDVLVVVKHAPRMELLEKLNPQVAVIYLPVDRFGSEEQIEAHRPMLRRCSRVVVHCERLAKYFEPYATVETIDHHLKFAAPRSDQFQEEGYVFWVGVQANLRHVVRWVNRYPLTKDLVVLANFAEGALPSASDLGFCSGMAVRAERWSPEAHRRWTANAKAALDIKGDSFRQQHKAPAKALDFIASGVPFAINSQTSVADSLLHRGFRVVSPLEMERWFSREYWEETNRFGAALSEHLSLEQIGLRFRRIIESVLTYSNTHR